MIIERINIPLPYSKGQIEKRLAEDKHALTPEAVSFEQGARDKRQRQPQQDLSSLETPTQESAEPSVNESDPTKIVRESLNIIA